MDRRFIELDACLDQAQGLLFDAARDQQDAWRRERFLAWVYHELQLEGVAARPSDIARAMRGEKGANYCDSVLIDQITRMHDTLQKVQTLALEERPWTIGTLSSWQRELSGALDVEFRKTPGATEQYKHDVEPPEHIMARLTQYASIAAKFSTTHPIEVAHETLWGLGFTWPFASWSGTCVRLATSNVLMLRGYPPLVVSVRERVHLYQAYHHAPERLMQLLLDCLRNQLKAQIEYFSGKAGYGTGWLTPREED